MQVGTTHLGHEKEPKVHRTSGCAYALLCDVPKLGRLEEVEMRQHCTRVKMEDRRWKAFPVSYRIAHIIRTQELHRNRV